MTIPVSRRLDFAEIPVIDLSEISASRQDISTVDAIRMACTEVGFFYITNHGVAANLIADLLAQGKDFFALLRSPSQSP